MATFTWKDTLTITVGEMSRTRALECTRHFDAILPLFTTEAGLRVDDLLGELDLLMIVYAPATVRHKNDILTDGEHVFQVEDEMIKLSLPLDRDRVNALPMSLSQAWVSAAVRSNDWLVQALKNASSLARKIEDGPKSGSGPSAELTPAVPTTTMIGNRPTN